MIDSKTLNSHLHEVGTFAEYKKQVGIQERAKAAYISAIRQNVFANFDLMELGLIKKLPKVI